MPESSLPKFPYPYRDFNTSGIIGTRGCQFLLKDFDLFVQLSYLLFILVDLAFDCLFIAGLAAGDKKGKDSRGKASHGPEDITGQMACNFLHISTEN
jgi:hypothetical protein